MVTWICRMVSMPSMSAMRQSIEAGPVMVAKVEVFILRTASQPLATTSVLGTAGRSGSFWDVE